MKYLIVPSKLSKIEELLPFGDAFLFGVKDLSVHFEHTYTLEELRDLILLLKKENKQVFLSCNRNYDMSDLSYLDRQLEQIETLDIDGVFYYDLAVLELVRTKYPSITLVWDQEHMTTNYFTASFYSKEGVKGMNLSTNLTLEELVETKKHTNLICIAPIFGYYPMFESKRHLVKNYLDTFSLTSHQGKYQLQKEGKTYPIVDHTYGTTVYTNVPLSGLEEIGVFEQAGMDYILFQEQMIERNIFVQVLEIYHKYQKNPSEDLKKELDTLLHGNYDLGFLYKKTVYKVKNYG